MQYGRLTPSNSAELTFCASQQPIRYKLSGMAANGSPVRRWTAEEVRLLIHLARRESAKEIASRLQRTVTAVRTKAAHERILLRDPPTGHGPARPRPPWEPADQ